MYLQKNQRVLEISQALQRGDARVGYLVKDQENKAAKAAAEISKS